MRHHECSSAGGIIDSVRSDIASIRTRYQSLPTCRGGERVELASGVDRGRARQEITSFGNNAGMETPNIEVHFGKTNSTLLSDAASIARRLPGFEQSIEGKKTIYSVKVPVSAAIASAEICRSLSMLIGISSRWQTTELLFDCAPVGRREVERELLRASECYQSRTESQLGDDYCSGKQHPADEARFFGCRQLRGVSRTVSEFGGETKWYHYGVVSTDEVAFTVDKTAIAGRLETDASRSLCQHCPAFRQARLIADVASLPDSVPLGEKGCFEVRRSLVNPGLVLGIQLRKETTAERSFDLATIIRELGSEPCGSTDAPAERSVPSVRYCDIAGMDRAIAEIRDVVELPLTKKDYFTAMGLRPHRGVILYGPPGNGKTLLVKAVATESDAHLEIINGPEILSKWVGQSEKNLREIFDRARRLQPSIVLIDELDAIAGNRDGMSQHHDVVLISQLLALLDGIEDLGDVFVVGTTNRIDAIDPAILRPGRFDYHISIQLPDEAGRLAVLKVHLGKLKSTVTESPTWLAQATAGWSGAELAAVCREAGLIAVKRAIRAALPADAVRIDDSDLRQALADLLSKRESIGSARVAPDSTEGDSDRAIPFSAPRR